MNANIIRKVKQRYPLRTVERTIQNQAQRKKGGRGVVVPTKLQKHEL